jgi:glycosyltransferase involved in cell wall biosynthesis
MKQDKISVIMPCFNAGAFILRGIESALNQTYDNIELIVINDGSTDDTLQIIENIRDHRMRVVNQQNKGVCASRNCGLSEANGDYIAFLDADDTWRPDCLKKLHGMMKLVSDAAVAYCGWQNVGLSGGSGEPYVPPDYEEVNKIEHLMQSCPWPIHAVLTKKTAIESSGGFDERFTNAEDYRLWLNIAAHSKIVRVPEVLALYHFHEGQQASKNRARAAYQQWMVQKEFIHKHPEIVKRLGYERVRQLTLGELLKKGYVCYWERDLKAAREIFRLVMKQGYGKFNDWKYMLPSMLPVYLHHFLIRLFEKDKVAAA